MGGVDDAVELLRQVGCGVVWSSHLGYAMFVGWWEWEVDGMSLAEV
jgi:hypothetical protein